MKAVKFKEANASLAENQPQYNTLPVHVKSLQNGWSEYTTEFEFSEIELAQIAKTGRIKITQSGYGFNPIAPSVINPFDVCLVTYTKNGEIWEAVIRVDSGEGEDVTMAPSVRELIDSILYKFPTLTADQLFFIENETTEPTDTHD